MTEPEKTAVRVLRFGTGWQQRGDIIGAIESMDQESVKRLMTWLGDDWESVMVLWLGAEWRNTAAGKDLELLREQHRKLLNCLAAIFGELDKGQSLLSREANDANENLNDAALSTEAYFRGWRQGYFRAVDKFAEMWQRVRDAGIRQVSGDGE